jgi:hypothetical protein
MKIDHLTGYVINSDLKKLGTTVDHNQGMDSGRQHTMVGWDSRYDRKHSEDRKYDPCNWLGVLGISHHTDDAVNKDDPT